MSNAGSEPTAGEALLSDWIGRAEEAHDEVTGPAAARVAALLDLAPRPFRRGDAIASAWYVMLFGPLAPQASLAEDGHPAKGQFLPPVALPRRMFAGRRVSFHEGLRVGDEMRRQSTILRIAEKQGRSGPMCFVTVRHEIGGPRGLAVIEEQDIVYRGESRTSSSGAPPTPNPSPQGGGEARSRDGELAHTWSQVITPTPAMVFRYSAITFNAHRIHYDWPYTRDVEGYPGLVVNGGLTTLLAWHSAARASGQAVRASATRNLRPLFVGRAITITAGAVGAGGSQRVVVSNDAGEACLEADLKLGKDSA